MVIWITGISGTGKSTLGKKLFAEVKKKNAATIFFDGDKFREIFQNDINYTLKDRDINAVRLTRLVKNLSLQKINIIISANLTNIKFRRWMKRNVKNYYEIYISASLKSLLKRDYKKLYSKAINKKIKNVVGVDLSFNEPKNSDLYLTNNNDKKIFLKSVDKILSDIKDKKKNFF
ncbi:adenylyl-sulfate kinase [Candidatus Pelagibacter sp.]|jgi:cytidine diphosphoramidate kinase|nr:adenylyl-sulfate kinase [Candidatus Pelagibacter sp.]